MVFRDCKNTTHERYHKKERREWEKNSANMPQYSNSQHVIDQLPQFFEYIDQKYIKGLFFVTVN
jgi:hypothetical protein